VIAVATHPGHQQRLHQQTLPQQTRHPPTSHPLALLVVGSGCPICRQYALGSMASRYRLILLDDAEPTWQAPYVADHIVVPFTDTAAVLDAVRRLAGRVDGVVTYIEQYLEITAEIATALGLPGNSVATVRACRDKLLTRLTLAAAGVPSARSIPITSLAAAHEAAADIGYPVVVKPRNLAGSLGVTQVHGPGELAEAYTLAGGSRLDGVDSNGPVELLVEEYLDGPHISVESVTLAGRTSAAAVTEHIFDFPPYFELTGCVVDTANPLTDPRSPTAEVARAALEALGFEYGVSHVEMRLTADGPRIVEVNARLAGARIPYLWQLASGVDLALAAANVAVGAPADLTRRREGAAAVRNLYPRKAGRVANLSADPVLATRAWLDDLAWEKSPGDEVKLPPNAIDDVLGTVVVTGPDAATCMRLLDEAEASITADIDPLVPVVATTEWAR